MAFLDGPGTGAVVVIVGSDEFGFGELVADEPGMSREGRVEDVGVVMAWEEVMRRVRGVEGSRGEAIVDILSVLTRSGSCMVYQGIIFVFKLRA